MHVNNGVVLAVAGSKGGVGKTTTSINLGAVLADAGEDVVLVEFDLAMANVGDFLDIDVGLDGADPTLHEVLAGTAAVVDATYEAPAAFDVVPSGATLRGYGDADIGRLSEVLETLRFAYDVVLLDTGAGVTEETVLPLALADETILVSSPRVASVRDTMKTRDLTRQVGGSVAGVVFVKSGTGRSPGVDHIAEFLSVDLLGHVPEDSAVPDAQDRGVPVVVAAPESDAAEAFRALGERITAHTASLGPPDALSTEGLGMDESGFAFVDASSETDGTAHSDDLDGASETPETTSVPDARQTANGCAEGTSAPTGTTPATDTATDANANENDDADANDDADEDDATDSSAGDTDGPNRADATALSALAHDLVTDVPETTAVPESGVESETVAATDALDGEAHERETVAATDALDGEAHERETVDTDDVDVDTADAPDPSPALEDDDVDAGHSGGFGVADGGHAGDDDGQDEAGDTQPEADGSESTPSATRRFIHRARGLVDRRSN